MTLPDFLRTTSLDNSLLIGYYGGGNYGDELLLEVLSNLLARQGMRDLTVAYQHPESYASQHRDFGFRIINIHSRAALIGAALRAKRIIIGGGGLWGIDMNTNTLLMSLFLFVSRWLFGKKIYLLGVGYYNSTPRSGRIAAWLAGKAANTIIARDPESMHNFARLSKHVHRGSDIAWEAPVLDPTPYAADVTALARRLPITGKTLLVAFRRPQSQRQHEDFVRFNERLAALIHNNPDRPVLLLMMELESKDPEAYEKARAWMKTHPHLRVLEAPYNPLTLFFFMQHHRKRLAIIAPQFHLLLTAHLAGIPFLPIVYDNKVTMLLDELGLPRPARLALNQTTETVMQRFANNFFGGTNA